jgi:hypothetical protein
VIIEQKEMVDDTFCLDILDSMLICIKLITIQLSSLIGRTQRQRKDEGRMLKKD